jgi:hypothetical protein
MLTDEIRARRFGRVTSSIVGACLGLDPFKSPADALDAILGHEPELSGNKACERGSLLEPAVLNYGLRIARELCPGAALEPAPYVDHMDGWAGDSTDAIYTSPEGAVIGVGEAKTVGLGGRANWGTPGTDEVPPHVFVQACWHLIHWPDAEWCLIPVVFGGYEFEFQHFIVYRDAALLGRLFRKLKDWHTRHVQNAEPVPLGVQDTDRIIKQWPVHVEQELIATPDLQAWVDRAMRAEKAEKAAAQEKQLARCEIRKLMQDKAQCRFDTWVVTYRKPKPTLSINWRTIAETLGATPELIAQHTVEVENTRRLCINPLRKLDT